MDMLKRLVTQLQYKFLDGSMAFLKKTSTPEEIAEIQTGLLKIAQENPEHAKDAVYFANLLQDEDNELVSTFITPQLGSGKDRKG